MLSVLCPGGISVSDPHHRRSHSISSCNSSSSSSRFSIVSSPCPCVATTAAAVAHFRILPATTTGPPGVSYPPHLTAVLLVTSTDVGHGGGGESIVRANAQDRIEGSNITTTDSPEEAEEQKLVLFVVLPVCLAVVAFVLVAVAVRCIRRRKAATQSRNVTPDLWIRHSQELPLYSVDCSLTNPQLEQPASPKTASLIEEESEDEPEKEKFPSERLKPRVSSFMIKKRVVKKEYEPGQEPGDDETSILSRSHSELADILSLPRSRASTVDSSSFGEPEYTRFQQRSPTCRFSIPTDRYRNGTTELRLCPVSLSQSPSSSSSSSNHVQRRMNQRRFEPPSLLLQVPSAIRTNAPRPTRPAPPPPPCRKTMHTIVAPPPSPSPSPPETPPPPTTIATMTAAAVSTAVTTPTVSTAVTTTAVSTAVTTAAVSTAVTTTAVSTAVTTTVVTTAVTTTAVTTTPVITAVTTPAPNSLAQPQQPQQQQQQQNHLPLLPPIPQPKPKLLYQQHLLLQSPSKSQIPVETLIPPVSLENGQVQMLTEPALPQPPPPQIQLQTQPQSQQTQSQDQ